MVGVVFDAIGYIFGDLTPLELRILVRVDFGQYFEFRAPDENFFICITSETSRDYVRRFPNAFAGDGRLLHRDRGGLGRDHGLRVPMVPFLEARA
ncbi:hypothetical protein H5410_000620 [Solanum commersonii]|uniref:Uncharacterized protein n=1 Tax=Solanum commersonii TaxID=4109 RepID=A0A9J6AXS1_SOLCO|nr:hypothetical protein H5410_000620 [Solanum commersonii]